MIALPAILSLAAGKWKSFAIAGLLGLTWWHGHYLGATAAEDRCAAEAAKVTRALEEAVAKKTAENKQLEASAHTEAVAIGDAYAQNIVALHKYYAGRLRISAARHASTVPVIPHTAGQPEVLAAYDGLAGRYSTLSGEYDSLRERCAATTLQLVTVLQLHDKWEKLHNGR